MAKKKCGVCRRRVVARRGSGWKIKKPTGRQVRKKLIGFGFWKSLSSRASRLSKRPEVRKALRDLGRRKDVQRAGKTVMRKAVSRLNQALDAA